jgi:hypothetical protein
MVSHRVGANCCSPSQRMELIQAGMAVDGMRALLNEWMNLPPCPQFWGNQTIQSPPILRDVGG